MNCLKTQKKSGKMTLLEPSRISWMYVCIAGSIGIAPLARIFGGKMKKLSYEEVKEYMEDYRARNGRFPTKPELCELLNRSAQAVSKHMMRVWEENSYVPTFNDVLTPDQLTFLKAIDGDWSNDVQKIMELTGFTRDRVTNIRGRLVKMGILDYSRPPEVLDKMQRSREDNKKKKNKLPSVPVYCKIKSGEYAGMGGVFFKQIKEGLYAIVVYNNREPVTIRATENQIEWLEPFEKIRETYNAEAYKVGIPRWGLNYREC